jgi:hypothetical protein
MMLIHFADANAGKKCSRQLPEKKKTEFDRVL